MDYPSVSSEMLIQLEWPQLSENENSLGVQFFLLLSPATGRLLMHANNTQSLEGSKVLICSAGVCNITQGKDHKVFEIPNVFHPSAFEVVPV